MNNKLTKTILFAAGAALVIFLAWYFSNILTYILIAAVLSLVGKPIVQLLRRVKIGKWRMPESLCAFITIIVIAGAFVCLFFVFAPILTRIVERLNQIDLSTLSQILDKPIADINAFMHKYVPNYKNQISLDSIVSNFMAPLVSLSRIEVIFNSVAEFITGVVIGLFVIVFITYYFLKEQDMFTNMVLSLFPDKYEPNARRALVSVNNLLVRYFVGILLETAAITLLNTAGLCWICKFDFQLALVLAFISGIINVIPYIGPICGGAIGVLIGLLTITNGTGFSSLTAFVLSIIAVYFCTHMIDIFVFQPNIYSKSVKAHPLEIFIVILIGGSVGGIIGMWIAIPAYTVIRVFAKEFFYNFKVVRRLTDKF